MTDNATRRVWFAASLITAMRGQGGEDRIKAIRAAYKNAGGRGADDASDPDGAVKSALLDARPWFASMVASIDDVCADD